MNSPRGKILVIRGGAIGDFILTLPAIAALQNQFPQAQLEVLGYPHIVQLARAGGLVDRVQSIEARALAGFFARQGSLTGVSLNKANAYQSLRIGDIHPGQLSLGAVPARG